MDEAAKVLERLKRVKELDERHASPSLVLEELRELVAEAERWVRVEGDARARAAALDLGTQVERVDAGVSEQAIVH